MLEAIRIQGEFCDSCTFLGYLGLVREIISTYFGKLHADDELDSLNSLGDPHAI